MGAKISFRSAERKDSALVLRFIKELAKYEKMQDEVIADEAMLEEWILSQIRNYKR